MRPSDYEQMLHNEMEDRVADDAKCRACGGAEVSWQDCDKGHEDCYQTDCDTPLGCGFIDRDCEDRLPEPNYAALCGWLTGIIHAHRKAKEVLGRTDDPIDQVLWRMFDERNTEAWS